MKKIFFLLITTLAISVATAQTDTISMKQQSMDKSNTKAKVARDKSSVRTSSSSTATRQRPAKTTKTQVKKSTTNNTTNSDRAKRLNAQPESTATGALNNSNGASTLGTSAPTTNNAATGEALEPSSQNGSSISGPTSTGNKDASGDQPAVPQKPDKDIRTKQVTTP